MKENSFGLSKYQNRT